MNKLFFMIIFGCSSVLAESPTSKTIDQYYAYASSGEWQQALPIIKGLVESDASIPSRWFQYGSCLEELGKHEEAIAAFAKAYQLDPTDFGAQYRIFRNYALAGDVDGFVAFARLEVKKTPQIIERINQREEFQSMTSSETYRAFLKQL
ncbi:MAG: tetratricopeptide repeat protein [Porticoccaceae bacterium]